MSGYHPDPRVIITTEVTMYGYMWRWWERPRVLWRRIRVHRALRS